MHYIPHEAETPKDWPKISVTAEPKSVMFVKIFDNPWDTREVSECDNY